MRLTVLIFFLSLIPVVSCDPLRYNLYYSVQSDGGSEHNYTNLDSIIITSIDSIALRHGLTDVKGPNNSVWRQYNKPNSGFGLKTVSIRISKTDTLYYIAIESRDGGNRAVLTNAKTANAIETDLKHTLLARLDSTVWKFIGFEEFGLLEQDILRLRNSK